MTLILSAEEAELFQGTLRKVLGELREEIHHTEAVEYKNQLKREEALLRGILDKVSARAA